MISALRRSFSSLRYLGDDELRLLAGASLLDTMSVSLVVPLLPIYADSLGASFVLIGVMFAAETLAKSVLSLPAGFVADRIDRKVLIVTGMFLSAGSVVLLGLVASPLVFIALRLVDGAGGAIRQPATVAYIGDKFSEEERGRAMGAYYTVGTIGLATGPALGGVIASVADLGTPFVLLGGATLLASLLLLVRLPRQHNATADDADDDRSGILAVIDAGSEIRPILSLSFLALAASAFLGQVGTGIFNPQFPVLLEQQVNAGPGYTGLAWSAFGLGMLLFTPVGGSLADSVGRVKIIVTSKVLWGITGIGLLYATWKPIPILLLFLGGFASAIAAPATKPLLYEIAPDGLQATTIGLFSSLTTLGFAVGPVLGGFISDTIGIQVTFVFVSVTWLVSAGFVAVGVEDPTVG